MRLLLVTMTSHVGANKIVVQGRSRYRRKGCVPILSFAKRASSELLRVRDAVQAQVKSSWRMERGPQVREARYRAGVHGYV